NGIPLSGAANDTLSFASLSLGDSGNYSCVITNACGVDTTDLGIIQVQSATEILSQPQSITLCEGDSANFSLTAKGTGLTYQWFKDGTSIPGANSTQLIFDSALVANSGIYYCEVLGQCEADTSVAVQLSVEIPPAITNQPVDIIANVGDTIQFAVGASGSNLNFQWYLGGSPVSGANGSILEITGVTPADSGIYYCVISGSCTPQVQTVDATLSVVISTRIDDFAGDFPISIFPNPTRGILNVEILKPILQNQRVSLLDLKGRIIKEAEIRDRLQINVSDLARGVYLIKIEGNEGTVIRKVGVW
ncbi:MAG: immunoglobulin domain-containing protein, partial [Bacteroidetes bacterium]|nr:immunoglobulin domain-containing protein [Bacteroidota bacterium]